MGDYELFLDEPHEVSSDHEENEETMQIRQKYINLFNTYEVEIPQRTAIAKKSVDIEIKNGKTPEDSVEDISEGTIVKECEDTRDGELVVVRMEFRLPFQLTCFCPPSFTCLIQSYPKHPLCIPSRGRAKKGNIFHTVKDRVKIIVVEPSMEQEYRSWIAEYNMNNFVLVVLPVGDRGIPFARELSLRFLKKVFQQGSITHFFMADDDLKEPVVAEITDSDVVTRSSTPHTGRVKWVSTEWENLFTEMENMSKEFNPALLAPTSTVDKKRNHPTQFPQQKVRKSVTLQQLVLVDLSKAEKLRYLDSAVLNWPDEEWRYCIEHRNEKEKIQKRVFQSEDFYICKQVPPEQSLTMVRFALTSLKLESQAHTIKEDKRSPQKIIDLLNSPNRFSSEKERATEGGRTSKRKLVMGDDTLNEAFQNLSLK